MSSSHYSNYLARPGIDYDAVASTDVISFAPGQTEAVLYVPTIEDDLDEADEPITFSRTDIPGTPPFRGFMRGLLVTIRDDDPQPVVSVEGPR